MQEVSPIAMPIQNPKPYEMVGPGIDARILDLVRQGCRARKEFTRKEIADDCQIWVAQTGFYISHLQTEGEVERVKLGTYRWIRVKPLGHGRGLVESILLPLYRRLGTFSRDDLVLKTGLSVNAVAGHLGRCLRRGWLKKLPDGRFQWLSRA